MVCKTAASRTRRSKWRRVALGAAFVCSIPTRAKAEPLRLRGDALAETQSPTGLIVLQGQDKIRSWVDVEGLVWAGARPHNADPTADILVLSMRLREPHGYGDLRAGRFVVATGAIRPVQIDGMSVLGRAPMGASVEAFGGTPVVPSFGARAYDWIVGGRVSQKIASRMTVGASIVERRTHGEIANDEFGADLAAAPLPWLDLAARSAYDLTNPGIADALVSTSARSTSWRVELFGSHRSPSRLLPATSLFSVLGDFPSDMLGSTVRWQAAPRLDLTATGAGQAVGAAFGGNAWLRALLRLNDRGDRSMGLEIRRQDVSTAQWTGFRGISTQPLGRGFRLSSEIELAFPDAPRGRGVAWPWALTALGWRAPKSGWEVAGALEASSTPEHRYEANALVRLSHSLAIK